MQAAVARAVPSAPWRFHMCSSRVGSMPAVWTSFQRVVLLAEEWCCCRNRPLLHVTNTAHMSVTHYVAPARQDGAAACSVAQAFNVLKAACCCHRHNEFRDLTLASHDPHPPPWQKQGRARACCAASSRLPRWSMPTLNSRRMLEVPIECRSAGLPRRPAMAAPALRDPLLQARECQA